MNSPYPPSPVPADQNLRLGELPFTAFGQWGEGNMDIRVFEQDIYWVNILGQPFLIEEMPQDYLCNVVMFLRDNATGFHMSASIRAALNFAESAIFGEPSGELALELLGAPRTHDLDPQTWLEGTPLMRKLLRQIRVNDAEGGGE